MPVEMWVDRLKALQVVLEAKPMMGAAEKLPLSHLADYYAHLYKLHADYEKNPEVRARQAALIMGWQEDVQSLEIILSFGKD
jgi:hypothetical protein